MGNGNAAAFDRGASSGATWHCAEDAEIADDVRDCVQEWPRDRRHWRHGRHWWRHGGRGKAVLFQEDGYAGPVRFDVTRQVRRGVTAWSIEADRARGGSLSYYSKEGALMEGHEGQAPQLILTR